MAHHEEHRRPASPGRAWPLCLAALYVWLPLCLAANCGDPLASCYVGNARPGETNVSFLERLLCFCVWRACPLLPLYAFDDMNAVCLD